MKAVHRSSTLLALLLALASAGPLAAKPDTAGLAATAQPAEKDFVARSGLSTAEVEAATAKAAKLTRKMTIYQVEQLVGDLQVAGKGGKLDDMVNAIPRLPGIKVTATNGICRYDFTSNDKGVFYFTSWTLLPGATPSK